MVKHLEVGLVSEERTRWEKWKINDGEDDGSTINY